MKRKTQFLIFIGVFLCSISGPIFAEDKSPVPFVREKKETEASNEKRNESLMNNTFVLETDDQSASESLERISGKIDMGFSAPENSYKSADHYAPGPFGKEKAEENKENNPTY